MYKLLIITAMTIIFGLNAAHAETDGEKCFKAYRDNITNLEKAYPVCLEAAKAGDASAQHYVGSMYESGNGVKQDLTEAAVWYHKSATQGDAIAQYALAQMYEKGSGVKQNSVDALAWLRKSAEQGNESAQYDLGVLYMKGTSVKQDSAEALAWLHKSAAQTSRFDDILGGYLVTDKEDTATTEVISWLRKAAERGDVLAQKTLGMMYYRGTRIKKNYDEAVVWYRKAAEQGDTEEQKRLGKLYESGTGVKQDYTEAVSWYRKAAEQGDSEAQSTLGMMYYFGKGIKQDYAEAVKWQKLRAEKGEIAAESFLCDMYYYGGHGLKRDYYEAFRWCSKSARNGFGDDQNALGNMYYEGNGVEKSISLAESWYRKAAAQDNKYAQYNLGEMYYSGKGVPKSFKEAFKWYQKSADNDHKESQWQVGYMYYTGEGVTQDNVKALAWFTLASTNDIKKAELRDKLEKNFKPEEVQQAQDLAITIKAGIDQKREQLHASILQKSTDPHQNTRTKPAIEGLAVPSGIKPTFTTHDYAVVIGIEKYRTVPKTEHASADARMVRDYLKALGIPERNIEFLADDRATLSDIRKVIETKLPNMVKANSRVIVYYAGHGAPGTVRGESYLVPYDGDPSFLADTAYPLSRLYDRLSRLKAKEVLVILDSCFSGSGGRSVIAKNIRPLVMVKDTPPPSSNKMIVLTSARGSQITTSLPEVGHGAFTYFFLRALQEGNRDIGEVYAYLKDRVTEEAKRQNVDQTPTISPEPAKLKGRFVFAR